MITGIMSAERATRKSGLTKLIRAFYEKGTKISKKSPQTLRFHRLKKD
jgi:hypothetical protein